MSARHKPATQPATSQKRGAVQKLLHSLELSEDGYSLCTKYDGDADDEGRAVIVGGEVVATFTDSDDGEELRDALLALAATLTPPALSRDLRECLDQAQALIQEAKGLADDGAVTDHLDFAEYWLGKINAIHSREVELAVALREAAHDLVSTASHHGSHAAIDQDKIDCLRDAVSGFDATLTHTQGEVA